MSVIKSNRKLYQRGATLIEVMIALLILAVGLLGFAGMQTRGIVTGRQAFLHSQAEILAEDMLERIRANRTQANLYTMGVTDVGVASNACDSNSCTPIRMREWDQYMWQSRVHSTLPGGTCEISATVGSNPYTTVKITVHYNLKTNESGSQAYDYVLSSQIYQ